MLFSLFLSLPNCKKTDIAHAAWPTTIMEGVGEPCPVGGSGRLHKGRPNHSTLSPRLDRAGWLPLLLLINTRQKRLNRKGFLERRTDKERGKRVKQRETQKKKKQKGKIVLKIETHRERMTF